MNECKQGTISLPKQRCYKDQQDAIYHIELCYLIMEKYSVKCWSMILNSYNKVLKENHA